MIELPEAAVLAKQINETVAGRKINKVVAAQNPHKFTWYYGDPKKYDGLLAGKVINTAVSCGGYVEIKAGDAVILFNDGASIRYYEKGERLPTKHQLWVELDDGSSLVSTVHMYGGIWAFPEGTFDNKYFRIAKEKPSPLTAAFDKAYYNSLFSENAGKLSLKAFLATEQRIPGLGNGVLQDILFNARMHPKKKVNTLSENDKEMLFDSLKLTLTEMVAGGGRDTETDLYGRQGGYKTILSRNTVNKPCPVCGAIIKKEAYLGGSIYYCPKCQTMEK